MAALGRTDTLRTRMDRAAQYRLLRDYMRELSSASRAAAGPRPATRADAASRAAGTAPRAGR